MTIALLLLISSGTLAAAALPDPRRVTELLYKALTIPIVFTLIVAVPWGLWVGAVGSESPIVDRVQRTLLVLTAVTTLAGWVLLLRKSYLWGRLVSVGALLMCLLAASHVLHDRMVPAGTGLFPAPKLLAMSVQTVACALSAAVVGLAPVLLIAAAQTWTRMLPRLKWAFLVACGARLAFAAVGFFYLATLLPDGHPTAGPVWLTLRLATLVALPVLAWVALRQRERGRGLTASRILLGVWGLALVSELLGFALLFKTSLPL